MVLGMYGGLGLPGLPALRGPPANPAAPGPAGPPHAMSHLFHSNHFRSFPVGLGGLGGLGSLGGLGAFGFSPGLLAHQGMRFGPLAGPLGGHLGGSTTPPSPCGQGGPGVSPPTTPSSTAAPERRQWQRDRRSPSDADNKAGDAGWCALVHSWDWAGRLNLDGGLFFQIRVEIFRIP